MIRLLKVFRVEAQRFRLSSSRYEQVILTTWGLVRLRVEALILPQLKPEDSGA